MKMKLVLLGLFLLLFSSAQSFKTLCAFREYRKVNFINPYILDNIPRNGLIAEYLFNGNANDGSGNGHNGTVYGATLTTDRKGYANSAYSFVAASQQYIDFGVLPLASLTSISISCWIKAASGKDLLIGRLSTNGAINTYGAYVERYSDNKIYIGVRNGSIRDLGYSDPSVNNWIHVVMVFNGSGATEGDRLKLYVNNQNVGTFSGAGSVPTTVDNQNYSFIVGKYYGSTYCNGSMDDIRVYNRALTTAEILALYNE